MEISDEIWQIVRSNAEQAMRLRTIIPAPVKQDAAYTISAVNGDSIEIYR